MFTAVHIPHPADPDPDAADRLDEIRRTLAEVQAAAFPPADASELLLRVADLQRANARLLGRLAAYQQANRLLLARELTER